MVRPARTYNLRLRSYCAVPALGRRTGDRTRVGDHVLHVRSRMESCALRAGRARRQAGSPEEAPGWTRRYRSRSSAELPASSRPAAWEKAACAGAPPSLRGGHPWPGETYSGTWTMMAARREPSWPAATAAEPSPCLSLDGSWPLSVWVSCPRGFRPKRHRLRPHRHPLRRTRSSSAPRSARVWINSRARTTPT